jgi:hypothetical protein
MLIQLSHNSKSQSHTTRKVGKKIISQIEQQIADLLQLRASLDEEAYDREMIKVRVETPDSSNKGIPSFGNLANQAKAMDKET